jgi:TatD DNase family protein
MSEHESASTNSGAVYDAHNHLQDAWLAPRLKEILRQLDEVGLAYAVVNGTREEDWDEVMGVCAKGERLLPSVGLHPWFVKERSNRWKEKLTQLIDANNCGIGEIGLDRWIKDFDWDAQQEVFLWQLSLAAGRNLPVSIHCLEAWGKMLELLEASPRPKCGFLLHSYGGPAEMTPAFIKLGGYFSFSGYFAHDRKGRQRDVFNAIPLSNILIETDAPDMLPPSELQIYPLRKDGEEAQNNPANIGAVYEYFARTFGIPLSELKEQVGANFTRLFGSLLG